ncbi:ion transporter [Henriciella marina]|uniref:Ion transporter n=1 Tax=Henriciella marina TaxID=453851 RepID=A0ABT4LTK8_9PROT|nr:ion transporter [Henriciella marina]MCZ4297467.1 ion transporter [Henriciella marina]
MAMYHIMTQIGLRKRLYTQMEPSAREKAGLSPLNLFIVILVLLSFLALALETEPAMGDAWMRAIDVFNVAIIVIFALEYLLRLWVAGENPEYRGVRGRVRYIFSGYALADLVAFLPELLWILLAPDDASAQIVMVLRVLRLARLAKISRFIPAFDVLGATLSRAGQQLFTTLAMAMALVYISAVLLYFVEGVGGEQQENFASIPRAIWWAIATLTTVGYGDVYPITPLGRIFASVIAIAGIGMVALPAGVFASAFSDEIREREAAKQERREQALERRAARIEAAELEEESADSSEEDLR